MTDHFSILPLDQLLKIILSQLEKSNRIFGISKELFFNPQNHSNLRMERFGQLLESPLGVAAGPQSQLAQNIVAAWLTGARFIELKTIQTLDELEVAKPCIDMQDEGYNCEWSQELKIHQSYEQYLNAWIIIHILRDKFGWTNDEPGVIFNMSVGYDLKGILNDNVQWFFQKMADCSAELKEKKEQLKSIYPNIEKLKINACISDNITLSTMHGCPANEIESIGAYLIEEKKLHTAIKLNPTLIGQKKLNEIMSQSGFETRVPDIAFEHDLKYPDAINIIKNLRKKALKQNLQFSLKLTNTLESRNHKGVFDSSQEMMYMSGKALHPISVNLAAKLQKEFDGQLDISFSGGADAFNVADLLNCGLAPVTICSDLLKPGGYGRLARYIENIENAQENTKSEFEFLKEYAEEVLQSKSYKKTGFTDPSIKTNRELNKFDCIHAPCVDTCPTNQSIPDYLYHTAQGNFIKAAEVILDTNPFPHTTGMVCDHLCQTKCTRINYDSPLLIREIKRFVAENYIKGNNTIQTPPKEKSVAVIGAGPSGLTAAYFLVKAGFKVDVYESKSKAGGMVDGAIPSFRLTDEAIDLDIQSIENLGVEIHYNTNVEANLFAELREKSDFIYIGTGAKKSKPLHIPGMDSEGVLDPLDFLFKVKENKESGIGKNVLIIGGGNTAMDAARTAYRMVGKEGKVTVVYRRTIKQMPADLGEIKAVIEEGMEIIELSSPLKINAKDGKVHSLTCEKMSLTEKDKSGRTGVKSIPDSAFEIEAETIIPAIGQELDIDFATAEELATINGSYQTRIPNVFIGGDALRGASTAINAIGDGRKAAQEIIELAKIDVTTRHSFERQEQDVNELMLKKTQRIPAQEIIETDLNDRQNFKLVSQTLTEEQAKAEASRCLMCDEVCNICSTVCPNLAFHAYETEPVRYQLPKIVSSKNGILKASEFTFEIQQKHQILHLADWCNKCGNCNTFCPTKGAPYQEKPHLYFNKEVFLQEKDGFYLDEEKEYSKLLTFKNDRLFELSFRTEDVFLKNDILEVKFNAENLEIIHIEAKDENPFELDLIFVAEMKVILEGALSFQSV